jgi:hypothetical protein
VAPINIYYWFENILPSFVTVTSPISSTSILSNPYGPNEVLTIFAIAFTAIAIENK